MSKVYPIRAGEDDRAKWQECADLAGLSFNAWAVGALNSQVDLELALARLEEKPSVSQVATRQVRSDFAFRPDPKPGKPLKLKRPNQ